METVPFIGYYACWALIPKWCASFCQNVYYSAVIPEGQPRPIPGDARYARDRRRIYLILATCYLFYTLFSSWREIMLQADFYTSLGVTPMTDERVIRSRFRRAATQLHPDKAAPGTNTGEAFHLLRVAEETLLDPKRRFLYDRFQYITSNQLRESIDVIVLAQLFTRVSRRALAVLVDVVLSIFLFPSWGRYWRFYASFTAFVVDLCLILYPNTTFIPSLYLPSWLVSDSSFLLPFQMSLLVDAAAKAFIIYTTRIAPPAVDKDSSSSSSSNDESKPSQHQGTKSSSLAKTNASFLTPSFMSKLSKLSDATQEVSADLDHLSNIEFDSFRGHEGQVELLRNGMTKLMMQTFFEDNLENMVQPNSPAQ